LEPLSTSDSFLRLSEHVAPPSLLEIDRMGTTFLASLVTPAVLSQLGRAAPGPSELTLQLLSSYSFRKA